MLRFGFSGSPEKPLVLSVAVGAAKSKYTAFLRTLPFDFAPLKPLGKVQQVICNHAAINQTLQTSQTLPGQSGTAQVCPARRDGTCASGHRRNRPGCRARRPRVRCSTTDSRAAAHSRCPPCGSARRTPLAAGGARRRFPWLWSRRVFSIHTT